MRLARLATLPIAFAVAAGAACFPSFAVKGGAEGDGGASSGTASGGGTSSGTTSGGGASSSGTSSGATSSSGTSSGGTSSGATSSSGTGSSGTSSGAVTDGGPGYVPSGTFTYVFSSGDPSATATFSHAFVMDVTEVTVADFTNWVNASRPMPTTDGQSLDPGGPNATQMYWQAAWNTYVAANDFKPSNGTCVQAEDLISDGELINALAPTYGSTPGTLPINCVNWFQAAAYCWWVGERLPTQAEWQYEAVGRQHGYTYPWGDAPAPTDCSHAIWIGDGGTTGYDGCGFPLPVGSAPAGVSFDGVQDLEGSLEEWIWDAFSYSDNTPWPTDYAGPPEDAGTAAGGRDIRGGSWFSPASSLQSILPANEGPTAVYTNLGFRCVKTVP